LTKTLLSNGGRFLLEIFTMPYSSAKSMLTKQLFQKIKQEKLNAIRINCIWVYLTHKLWVLVSVAGMKFK